VQQFQSRCDMCGGKGEIFNGTCYIVSVPVYYFPVCGVGNSFLCCLSGGNLLILLSADYAISLTVLACKHGQLFATYRALLSIAGLLYMLQSRW